MEYVMGPRSTIYLVSNKLKAVESQECPGNTFYQYGREELVELKSSAMLSLDPEWNIPPECKKPHRIARRAEIKAKSKKCKHLLLAMSMKMKPVVMNKYVKV